MTAWFVLSLTALAAPPTDGAGRPAVCLAASPTYPQVLPDDPRDQEPTFGVVDDDDGDDDSDQETAPRGPALKGHHPRAQDLPLTRPPDGAAPTCRVAALPFYALRKLLI